MDPKRILVVDDEIICREPLTMMLAHICHHAEIFQAENGKDGLEILETRLFDLVFTDYQMPQMDGLILTRKAKEKYPEIKIIFSSGYDDQQLAENALQAGADLFIQKPITLTVLGEIIPRL